MGSDNKPKTNIINLRKAQERRNERAKRSNRTRDLPPVHGQHGKPLQPIKERSKRRPPKDRKPSFKGLFFDDADDFDSKLYTNALNSDAKDEVSTKEFIKLSNRVLKDREKKRFAADEQETLLQYAQTRSDHAMKKIESIRAKTPDLFTLPTEGYT